MAHKLGAAFHIPHGLANALLINEVIRFNATTKPTKQGTFPQYKCPDAKERYASLADFLKLGGKNDDEKVERLIAKVQELKDRLQIPKTIQDAGVPEKQFLAALDKLSEDAFDDQCTGANPRYPLISESRRCSSELITENKPEHRNAPDNPGAFHNLRIQT